MLKIIATQLSSTDENTMEVYAKSYYLHIFINLRLFAILLNVFCVIATAV